MPAPIPLVTLEQIRQSYIEGNGTIGELAEKHGLSEATIRDKCRGQGWVRAREDYILAQRGLRESKGAISGIVPREPRQPISVDYFLVHGERLYQQVAVLGNHVAALDTLIESQLERPDAPADEGGYDAKTIESLIRCKLAIMAEWKDLQGIARIAPRKVREKAVSQRSSAIPIDSPTDIDQSTSSTQDSDALQSPDASESTPLDVPPN